MTDPPHPQLRVDAFDYDLPSQLIAQEPLPDRDASRLLVLDRAANRIVHSEFRALASWLQPGDLLVANDSRVLPARLFAQKASGGRVELLLLRREACGSWLALAKPARRLRPGLALTVVPAVGDTEFGGATVEEVLDDGQVRIRLSDTTEAALDRYGHAPLPPYIHAPLAERERYQTIFGTVAGSAAAPTAGLHFTTATLAALAERGVGLATVTLHVGLDTFRPVTAELVAEHTIHQEWCVVSDAVARQVEITRAAGGRIIAIGTTAARTVETLGQRRERGESGGFQAMTGLFITPGYRWRLVDALLTNFHLPRSTLLMMVSALAGQDLIRRAYAEAIRQRYRFYSFGDAMLIV